MPPDDFETVRLGANAGAVNSRGRSIERRELLQGGRHGSRPVTKATVGINAP
jgi:hypothetical protein